MAAEPRLLRARRVRHEQRSEFDVRSTEKLELLDALVKGGVPAGALMPGTGHCALSDSIKMTREAVRMGCGGVLMLPPFYYKSVPDEGLFRNFSEVIERVGDERLRLYLYHIPPVVECADHARVDRSAADALSGNGRRRQGFVGRLVKYESDARSLQGPQLRRVRRQRSVPARQHAHGAARAASRRPAT
jgi:hypothetical protein